MCVRVCERGRKSEREGEGVYVGGGERVCTRLCARARVCT